MVLIGQSKKKYIIADKYLAKGGEGSIFPLVGDNSIVAKIYHPNKISPGKEKKLLAMVLNPPSPEALTMMVWPLDVLYDNNQFVGFIMPRVTFFASINSIYAVTSDHQYESIGIKNRIEIAKELCVAINAVHERGHVVGDLNPNNILVNPKNNSVLFVDTDSYHIRASDGTIYRCEVGLGDYIAPELQSKMRQGLNNCMLPTFTVYTDYFALAIHIFQLLMNGTNPFSAAQIDTKISAVLPLPNENIEKGRSPFFNSLAGFTIPAYSPKLSIWPDYIVSLFRTTFVDGYLDPSKRITPKEFYKALNKLSKELRTCSQDHNHQFYDHLGACPWCDLQVAQVSRYQKAAKDASQKVPMKKINVPTPNHTTYTPSKKHTYKPSYNDTMLYDYLTDTPIWKHLIRGVTFLCSLAALVVQICFFFNVEGSSFLLLLFMGVLFLVDCAMVFFMVISGKLKYAIFHYILAYIIVLMLLGNLPIVQ